MLSVLPVTSVTISPPSGVIKGLRVDGPRFGMPKLLKHHGIRTILGQEEVPTLPVRVSGWKMYAVYGGPLLLVRSVPE